MTRIILIVFNSFNPSNSMRSTWFPLDSWGGWWSESGPWAAEFYFYKSLESRTLYLNKSSPTARPGEAASEAAAKCTDPVMKHHTTHLSYNVSWAGNNTGYWQKCVPKNPDYVLLLNDVLLLWITSCWEIEELYRNVLYRIITYYCIILCAMYNYLKLIALCLYNI